MRAVFSSGSVLANGKPLVENDRHAIAYIAQEDHLMPTSTVFDTLNLSAQLRLPRSWSAERKAAVRSSHGAQTRTCDWKLGSPSRKLAGTCRCSSAGTQLRSTASSQSHR